MLHSILPFFDVFCQTILCYTVDQYSRKLLESFLFSYEYYTQTKKFQNIAMDQRKF